MSGNEREGVGYRGSARVVDVQAEAGRRERHLLAVMQQCGVLDVLVELVRIQYNHWGRLDGRSGLDFTGSKDPASCE